MKYALLLTFLLGYSAGAQQQPKPPVSVEGIEEQVKAMSVEQVEAARSAIKRVHLLRMMFLVHARHRNTPEHGAECLAMARRLQAPSAYVNLLEEELAAAPLSLSGRAYYEHNKLMAELMRVYKVDELSARLLAERVHCDEQQAREFAEWLPVQYVFDRVPMVKFTPNDYVSELQSLRDLFEHMQQEYAKVVNRASADAAADALLGSLPLLQKTAHLRLMIGRKHSTDIPGYQQFVYPVEQKLNELRARLIETSFYGSKKLSAMDELMCL